MPQLVPATRRSRRIVRALLCYIRGLSAPEAGSSYSRAAVGAGATSVTSLVATAGAVG